MYYLGRHTVIRVVLIIITVLFILGLLFYEPIKSKLVTGYRPADLDREPSGRLYKPVNYNMGRAKPVTMHDVINARLHSGDIRAVGQIVDPDAQMRLPIGLGVDNDTLMLAAGTLRPHEVMGRGNYALAGHHMVSRKALFTPLCYYARKGQMIYLVGHGQVYSYQIDSRQVIGDHDVNVVENTKRPIMTLVTCNSSHLTNKRLVVRAHFKHRYRLKNADEAVKRALVDKTNNYQVLKGY